MQSDAKTVDEYLASLPDARRAPMRAVVELVRAHIPDGYEEGMQYGMIGWSIPLSRYPNTYNGQPLGYVALASQKQAMSLYLMGVYGDPARERLLRDAYAKAGKRLDMGKSCLRFQKIEDLELGILGELIESVSVDDYVRIYEAWRAKPGASTPSKRGKAGSK